MQCVCMKGGVMRISIWLAALASTGIAVAFSQPAIGSDSRGYEVADSTADLKLKLDGFIKPYCSIDIPDDKLWFPIYDEAGDSSVAFNVNCNQDLKVEISSLNGGLQHAAFHRIPDYDGFSEFLPYNLSFAIDAANAQALNFQSEQIKAAPGRGSIGIIPYSASGRLDLSWAPSEPLIAGEYRDVIEIRVTGDGGSNGHR